MRVQEDAEFCRLRNALEKHVRASVPITSEQRRHLEAVAEWAQESVAIARKAQQLTAEGSIGDAQRLLEEHNAARPRRRPGRPIRHIPKRQHIEHALLCALAQIALARGVREEELIVAAFKLLPTER